MEWDPEKAFKARRAAEDLRKSQEFEGLWQGRVRASPLIERWPEVIDIVRGLVARMNESSLGPAYEAIVNPEDVEPGAYHTICVIEQGSRGPAVQILGTEETSEGRIMLAFLPDRYIPPLHYDKFEFTSIDPEIDPSPIAAALDLLIRSEGIPAGKPRPRYDQLNNWKGLTPPNWQHLSD
jgi:hypothetical protein